MVMLRATQALLTVVRQILRLIFTTVALVKILANPEKFAATENAPLLVLILKQTVVALVLILRILTFNLVQEQH